MTGQSFGVSRQHGARFNLNKLAPMLDDLHSRLAGVTIECLPYADFIGRYDGPGTLFYVDPPYWGTEGYYGEGMFSRGEFEHLRDVLSALQGRFILSINDVPEIREIFAAFSIEAVSTTYSAGGGENAKPGANRELIITG